MPDIIDNRETKLAERRALGGDCRVIAETSVPALPAPVDFEPKTAPVSFALPNNVKGELTVIIDADEEIAEVTEVNNSLTCTVP